MQVALLGLCAAALPAQLPQCLVRNQFRVDTSMPNGNPPGARLSVTGWQTAAPITTYDALATTNSLGCSSQGDCTATSDFGLITCNGSGSASTTQGTGAYLGLDMFDCQFLDVLTVVSATLPAGTPVQIRYSLGLSGFATVVDPQPVVQYRATLRLTFGPTLSLDTRSGIASATVTALVGGTLGLSGHLQVTLRANGLPGIVPGTASYAVDLRAVSGITVLTPGASVLACSGRTYGAWNANVRSVGGACGLGPPVLSATAPAHGTTLGLAMSGAAPACPVLFGCSLGPAVSTPLGACTLQLNLAGASFFLAGTTDPAGAWTLGFPIPPEPGLAGVELAAQTLVLRAGGPMLGTADLANGLELRIGL
jgi:hypothetical protein